MHRAPSFAYQKTEIKIRICDEYQQPCSEDMYAADEGFYFYRIDNCKHRTHDSDIIFPFSTSFLVAAARASLRDAIKQSIQRQI